MSRVTWHVVQRDSYGKVIDVSESMPELAARAEANWRSERADPVRLVNRHSETITKIPRFVAHWKRHDR